MKPFLIILVIVLLSEMYQLNQKVDACIADLNHSRDETYRLNQGIQDWRSRASYENWQTIMSDIDNLQLGDTGSSGNCVK